jgi:hypothetical protein
MKMMLVAILLVAFSASAQTHRDPLIDREVDEMRESAQNPKQRIDYLIGFARERVLAIERLRTPTQPGLNDDGKMAELLGDLAALIDELDDNLEMYNSHSEDLRHPLRHVIDAESEFQQKLKALSDNATPLRKHRIAVALEDASDSLHDSTESARAMLADQLEKKGAEKNDEKVSHRRHASDAEDPPPDDEAGMGGVRTSPSQR